MIISAWLGTVQFTKHKGHIQTKGLQTAGQMKQKQTKENPSTKKGKRKEGTQRKGPGRLEGHGVCHRWNSSEQRNHVTFLFGGQHIWKTAQGPRSHLGNLSNGTGEPPALHGCHFFPIKQAAVPFPVFSSEFHLGSTFFQKSGTTHSIEGGLLFLFLLSHGLAPY